MPIYYSEESEYDGLLNVARLMTIAARTAPKTRGVDGIVTAIVIEKEKDAIADRMASLGENKSHPLAFFVRDADNLRNSPVLVLIGVKGTMPKRPENPFNCGACGFENCSEFIRAEKKMGEDFKGPICVWHSIDLGISLASAVKTASDHNVDNRMMYSIGVAAKSLDTINADVIVGIPISSYGKNIYFDRG